MRRNRQIVRAHALRYHGHGSVHGISHDPLAPVLARVQTPTLLIVGGDDPEVITLNQRALAALQCERELSIVPGATHLFEEPGTLEQAAKLAHNWFEGHLKSNGGV